MKRKDKRQRPDSSTKDSTRTAKSAPREDALRTRARSSKGPNKKRRARSGRKREQARSRAVPHRELKSAEAPPSLRPSESGIDAARFGADVDTEEAFELGIGSRVVPPTTQYGEAFDSTPPSAGERRSGDLEAQIRSLEARLDGLIRRRDLEETVTNDEADVDAQEPPPSERHAPLARASSAPPATVETAEAVADDFISRKWGRTALRKRAEDFDDFGLDPDFERRVLPAVDFLFRSYFRTSVEGIDSVPAEGRCILVANHSGAFPLDGPMLRAALRLEHAQRRDLRWLAEDFVY
ncbi:MAG TPA: hypothetical protein VHV51_22760, partial [Polyangiaceae bacterium]|nr:hypothetical protein [Polyangiaceae bacterium]